MPDFKASHPTNQSVPPGRTSAMLRPALYASAAILALTCINRRPRVADPLLTAAMGGWVRSW